MRKIWREVTRKLAAQFEAFSFAKLRGARESVDPEKSRLSDARIPRLRARLGTT